MSLRNGTILLFAVVLTACGGGGGGSAITGSSGGTPRDAGQADLYYTYPADNQTGVAPHAPLVLGFMSQVDPAPSNFILNGPDGRVQVTVKTANGGKSVVLTPDQPLALKSQYKLTVNGLENASGGDLFPDGSLDFSTRPALEGPLELRETSPTFEVSAMSPDGTDLPFLDYSSVDLTLTQPIDPQTVVYGSTVTLTQNGQPVDATLLVDGNDITIDPVNAAPDPVDGDKNNHDLTPGVPVTVTLTSGVKNIRGEALTAFSQTVTPKDTTPRSTLVQQAAPANDSGTCLDSNVITSPLTGDPINCVPVIARLLGSTTVSKQQGNIYAQLAFGPHFPQVTPLRIPKGSLLKGDPLKVLIGGKVDAGFDSGQVTVTFLSDANGYLMPNPYTDNPEAPRRLVLTMDVAFNTEDPRANGAFNQKLLHVKLIGTAITNVDKGSLIVNAVGVVEPRVLGSEDAYGVLSFHMESFPDQQNAPPKPVDQDGPTLGAWMPGDNVDKQRPGDPIILSFNEPLDNKSIQAGTSLTVTDQTSGQGVPFTWYQDGVDVVIKPEDPLAYNDTYQVSYTSGVTDLAGNTAQPNTVSFTMPTYDSANPQAPLVLTAYPGFPCVTTGMNLASGDAGQCAGGKSTDDHLPLARMPANRPIRVTFSQVIDPTTVNASTFTVEQVDASGNASATVAGHTDVNGRTLTFTPDQPWQTDAYYRYTLKSVSSSANCGGNAICDERGYPLQTKLLAQTPGDAPGATDGGPNLPVYFQGVAAEDGVMQRLRNLPTADVNANFLREASEPKPSTASDPDEVIKNSAHIVRNPSANPDDDGTAASGSAISDAKVGCDFGDSCPDAKYGYITGNLSADLVGYRSASEVDQNDPTIPDTVKQNGGVLVYIHPTRIVVSSVTVYTKVTAGVNLLASADPAPTGPQLMRIRYTCDPSDSSNPCSAPDYGRVKGWIVNGQNGPVFKTTLDLYLDAPKLSPTVHALGIPASLTHNLHSYPLTVGLSGDVSFLDDGRLQISQLSTNKLDISVVLGGIPLGLTGTVYVGIPAGETNLNYVTAPIKN